MQSLLPNQGSRHQDRHTFFIMMLMFFAVYFLFLAPRQPQKVDIDTPPLPQQQEEPFFPQESVSDPSVQTMVETETAPAWVTLGSMDAKSPYRMLITFTNQGAAPCRIELNTPQYRDVHELSGYLGQIVADQRRADESGNGVTVQVLGPGTPAEKYGLHVGDKIVQINLLNRKTGKQDTIEVKTFTDLRNALLHTRPNDFVDLTVSRKENRIEQRVQLGQYPMDVIRPETVPKNYDDYRLMGGLRGVDEQSDQLSFLTTLQQIDDQQLNVPASQQISNLGLRGMIPPDPTLGDELPNVALRNECWEIISALENEVVFRRTVPLWNLEVLKTYRLQRRDEADAASFKTGAGYELTLTITVKNQDTKTHKIAYQLDGPTGLPLEGGWYAMKTGPSWGMYGNRDLVVRLQGNKSRVVSNNEIHVDRIALPWIDISPEYIGVDSLYFQCTLKPNKPELDETWHSKVFPMRVGTKNTDWTRLTNVSFRMWSKAEELPPEGGTIEHAYTLFAGPKDTVILAEYGLSETISYGWFWFAAMPLLGILHFFHSLGLSYAMAIILLTICVRLLLFPLSIKQAVGAIKMQQIQPELKALAEKYKDDMQARSRAQSALFKKHGYHPVSGCLPIFIQLPIFIGLYKALSIDAGLYGTPLFSSSMRWCSDLSAPDMLYDWSNFWNWLGWTSFNTGQGMFSLGPYFNLLPMLTVTLFVIQMVFTMPPPTDDQSRMQRKMMQYMMIFMGLLFFKVPSGLCLYFIVSTVWGLLERRFIPKSQTQLSPPAATSTYDIPSTEPPKTLKPAPKKGTRDRHEQIPPKKEGTFAKWWREVLEKAAEQQKLGRSSKEKNKKRKKKEKW